MVTVLYQLDKQLATNKVTVALELVVLTMANVNLPIVSPMYVHR